MAEMTLPQAIDRLKSNELRIQDFVNGNASGYYVTSGGVQVKTLPSFQTELAAAIASANAALGNLSKPTGTTLIGHGTGTLKQYLDAQAQDLATAKSDASSAKTAADAALPKSGGTMTGALTLSAAPTAAKHAATKEYVDANSFNLAMAQAVALCF